MIGPKHVCYNIVCLQYLYKSLFNHKLGRMAVLIQAVFYRYKPKDLNH